MGHMKISPVLQDFSLSLLKKTASGPIRWILIAVILCGSTVFCFYAGHPEWLIRVGVLGVGLLAFFFYSQPTIRTLISIGILGVSLVLVFYHLGDGSFYNWDEAIYAEVAKEMLASRDWASLTWNGFPFLQKPPLQFWLTALTYKLFGINEFAARLWPAIFGFGTVALTFLFGVRLSSWSAGAAAALILLSVDHTYFSYAHNFLSLARVGMLDTAFTFWFTLSLLILWESNARPWLFHFFGIPLGLAAMTKSWPALFAIIILVLFSTVGNRSYPKQLKSWTIAAVFAGAIILPWHLWELWHYGNDFIHESSGKSYRPSELNDSEQQRISVLLSGCDFERISSLEVCLTAGLHVGDLAGLQESFSKLSIPFDLDNRALARILNFSN